MIHRIVFIVFLSISPKALFSQVCPPSAISDSWTIGVTITQIFLGALQTVGASASFIADGLFFLKADHQRIRDIKQELRELREENHQLKLEIPKKTLEIFDILSDHIERNPYDIESDKELAELFKDLEKTFTEFADEYYEGVPINDGDAGSPRRSGRFSRFYRWFKDCISCM